MTTSRLAPRDSARSARSAAFHWPAPPAFSSSPATAATPGLCAVARDARKQHQAQLDDRVILARDDAQIEPVVELGVADGGERFVRGDAARAAALPADPRAAQAASAGPARAAATGGFGGRRWRRAAQPPRMSSAAAADERADGRIETKRTRRSRLAAPLAAGKTSTSERRSGVR